MAGLLQPSPACPLRSSSLGLPVPGIPEGHAWCLLHWLRGLLLIPPAGLSDCHGVQSSWRQHLKMPKSGEGPGEQMDSPISQLSRLRQSITRKQGSPMEPPSAPLKPWPGRQELVPKVKLCLRGPAQSPCLGRPVGLGHNQAPSLLRDRPRSPRPPLKPFKGSRIKSFFPNLGLKASHKLTPTHPSNLTRNLPSQGLCLSPHHHHHHQPHLVHGQCHSSSPSLPL